VVAGSKLMAWRYRWWVEVARNGLRHARVHFLGNEM
jgi:hypothetical protein